MEGVQIASAKLNGKKRNKSVEKQHNKQMQVPPSSSIQDMSHHKMVNMKMRFQFLEEWCSFTPVEERQRLKKSMPRTIEPILEAHLYASLALPALLAIPDATCVNVGNMFWKLHKKLVRMKESEAQKLPAVSVVTATVSDSAHNINISHI